MYPRQITAESIRNAMTWPGLTQDVEHGMLMLHLSSISHNKEGAQKNEFLPAATRILESDI
jgi:hypothetical protein